LSYNSRMCGIAGKIYFGEGKVNLQELGPMSSKIAHRGPDDEGFYVSKDKRVGLVNRRLAIIDLSAKGHQPMRRGSLVITFNGEIYNFKELRESLEKDGNHFTSGTDTEVILTLYQKWGPKCLKFLRGMFALAIYDERQNTVFIARDRLGKKPLKYFFKNGVFIFASELKAILTQKEVSVTPDWVSISNFLTYGYVAAPETGFEEIHKLEPAHFLLIDLKKGKIRKERYWFLDYSEKLSLSEEEWVEKILDEVGQATRLRMIADVPLGAFLSGGVDSSLVVATMAGLSSKPVKTFTIGFKEEAWSEAKHAQRIAKLYRADHTTLIAEPSNVEILSELAYQYEEPFADASSVVTYMVSKLARKHVTVILNGDGGDENFAGYDRFFRVRRDANFESFLPILRTLGIPIAALLKKERIRKFLQKSKLPFSHRYVTYNSYFLNEDKETLFTPKFENLTLGTNSYKVMEEKFMESGVSDFRDAALYSDISMYLPDDLLAKVDIASMAVSLEGRSPLLDHNLVELAAKIPFGLKVKGKDLKYILKKAAERLVPKENLYRPKMGFSIPLKYWFSGKIDKYAGSVLLSQKAASRGLFKQEAVKRMFKAHGEKEDFGPKLWALLSLELWFRQYLD